MRITITALQCLCFQSAVVLQLNSNFANALVEDGIQKAGTVAAKEFVDPGLAAVDDTRFEHADTLPSLAGLANMDFMAVDNPFGPSGSALGKGQVTIDSRSGVVASLNITKPILPGTGVGNALLWSVGAMPEADNIHGAPEEHRHWEKLAEEAVQNWMHENESFLGINSHDELFSAGRTRLAVHGNGNMIQLSMERTHLGIPVVGNRASATIKRGNLINIGLEHWGKIPKELDPKPSITVQEAFEALAKHSGETLVSGQESCKPELQILTRAKGTKPPVPSTPASPIQGIFGSRGENRRLKKRKNKGDDDTATYGDGYDYTLVWKVCPMFVGQQQEIMEGYVDAHTAQVYSYVDTVDYFNARGSVYPTSNDGEGEDGKRQQDWPMPFMQVGSEITTTGGNYNNGGEQTASYYGPYVDMQDNCGSDFLKQSGGIDWGDSGGTDCK